MTRLAHTVHIGLARIRLFLRYILLTIIPRDNINIDRIKNMNTIMYNTGGATVVRPSSAYDLLYIHTKSFQGW